MRTIFKKSSLAGLTLLVLMSGSAQAKGGGHAVPIVRQQAVTNQEAATTEAQQTADNIAISHAAKGAKNPPQPAQQLTGFYFGAFGGYGAVRNNWIKQSGTVFATSGPVTVAARGRAQDDNSSGGGFGGLHVGYEWGCPCWVIDPAVELEAYYLGLTQFAELDNTAATTEHVFFASFPMHTWVTMANSVWTLKLNVLGDTLPYIGVGVGAADVSISGANSQLVGPVQTPYNYFNSNTQSSNWAFAMQAKAGIRFYINPHWRIFAEYRYLYIAPTTYTFGSRQYPGANPTSNWNVRIASMNNNMGALGVEYAI